MKIRKALSRETKGSTVILISHRITTLMHADKILVLDRGRLIESERMTSYAQWAECTSAFTIYRQT